MIHWEMAVLRVRQIRTVTVPRHAAARGPLSGEMIDVRFHPDQEHGPIVERGGQAGTQQMGQIGLNLFQWQSASAVQNEFRPDSQPGAGWTRQVRSAPGCESGRNSFWT